MEKSNMSEKCETSAGKADVGTEAGANGPLLSTPIVPQAIPLVKTLSPLEMGKHHALYVAHWFAEDNTELAKDQNGELGMIFALLPEAERLELALYMQTRVYELPPEKQPLLWYAFFGEQMPGSELPSLEEQVLEAVAGEPAQRQARKTTWTADELLITQFPEPKWAIPGIIPEGLSILAGRPKLGKSWLALQWACAVGTGGRFFGQEVPAGKVLYLALEDNPKRLKKRITAQTWPKDCGVTFETAWADLLDGGLIELEARLRLEHYALIIIDTLSRVVRFDQQEVDSTTAALTPLQHLALDNGMSIVLVDHHRKTGFSSVDDVIDEVLGSTGKAAVVDAVLGLFRDRGKKGATLKITGRDLEDSELVINWDRESCCWQLEGDARQTARTDGEREMIEAIEALGGEATTKALAEYLDQKRGNVSVVLGGLLERGLVVRGERNGKEVPYRINRA